MSKIKISQRKKKVDISTSDFSIPVCQEKENEIVSLNDV